jgi:hypothetical protein
VDAESALVDGFLDVGRHVDGGGSVAVVGDFYPEEFVGEAACDGHCTESVFEEVKDFFDNGRAVVGDFHVVDVPRDGALGAVDGGIGDARIVRI